MTAEKFHLEVAGCFLVANERFLLLHRLPNKSQGNKWGIPAGKRESHEDERAAVVREVFEETGIQLNPELLEELPRIDWDFTDKTVSFTPFRFNFMEQPDVQISSSEHQGYAWVTAQECKESLPLMHGVEELLAHAGF